MATVPPPSTREHYRQILLALWARWRAGLPVTPAVYQGGGGGRPAGHVPPGQAKKQR